MTFSIGIDPRPLAIDLFVAGGAVLVLLWDALLPPALAKRTGPLTGAILLAALALSFFVDTSGETAYGAYAGGPWPLFVKRAVLAAGVLGVLGASDWVERRVAGRRGEYWMLMLLSIVGMMMLAGARDLVLFVVCFELMGMPLYILCAYGKNDGKGGRRFSEAALKFYLTGAASTAVTLFGLSFVVGSANTTRFSELGSAAPTPLLTLGMLLLLAGTAFKIGAVPFHMWIPDTYQGSATPFVAFLSVAPKAATLAALVGLFGTGFGQAHPAWLSAAGLVAAATMTLGNVLAVAQSSAKRLLGYSGISQVGYMLLGLAAGTREGGAIVLFYVAGYVVSNMGAFLVVQAVCGDDDDSLERLHGLWKRTPWLAFALLFFLLSLAGVPFMIGFWAKLWILVAAWHAGLRWLVVLGALLATVGLFYYLVVLKNAYMTEPKDDKPVRVPGALATAIVVCMLAVALMGAYPAPWLDAASGAAAALFGDASLAVR